MVAKQRRSVVGALAGALGALSLATIGPPAASAPSAPSARAGDRATGHELVVAFDSSPGRLRRAVDRVGGRVVDVNEQLGVALVAATDGSVGTALAGREGVTGVMPNHSVGLARPGMPHRRAGERPAVGGRSAGTGRSVGTERSEVGGRFAGTGRSVAVPSGRASGSSIAASAAGGREPLADLQWDMAMIGATDGGAHQVATGAGVDVGIIDTGIDASHPDIAPNFDAARSRNFTKDIPELDGPCEHPSCVDPVGADERGHGTHVAGIVAAARNGFGTSGVAPDATLVNLRAGQDSGFFFLYETLEALTAAADMRLDVVNMSFYTDPWLYNCDSPDDYISGQPTAEELEEQRLTRVLLTDALEYAHDRGVTMIAAVGNEHTDLAAPERVDPYSPGLPWQEKRTRVVTRDCLDLPSEGPHVLAVGAVGPSGTKTDYSNYGLGSIDLTAPGGWIRDGVGTPRYRQPGNLVLAPYPAAAGAREGLVGSDGKPVDAFSVRQCAGAGRCGLYAYLQGTSMATPHVVGVAALVVERYGRGSPSTGHALAPDRVAEILAATAADRACPAGGVADYAAEGRAADWAARCEGTAARNGFYGEGIVDAAAAVR